MQILLVLENYWPHVGGVETLFQNLAEGLVKKGHGVTIVTHKMKGGKKYEVKNGVKIHRVHCFGNRYLFTFLSIPKIFGIAKSFDVIHTTTFNGAPPAWLVSKLRRKPCLLTVHEIWIGNWRKFTNFGLIKSGLHNLLERLIFLLNFSKYVGVSNSTRNQLIRVGKSKDKVGMVYNGLDYTHFNKRKHGTSAIRKELGFEKDFVCLSYGRLGPSKGLKYAIKAVPMLAKKLPNFKYVLILSKDKQYRQKRQQLEKAVAKSSYSDSIKVLDSVSYKKLPSYIKAANCVIVPSLSEGFGYTVAESCALDVPVIASNTTSIPEVISGKFILVEPKNTMDIIEAVQKVERGRFTKRPLRKFTWPKTVEGYLNIYKELVK